MPAGEGSDERDLGVGERLNLELVKDDDTDDVVPSEHGHSEFRSDGINVSQRAPVLSIRADITWISRLTPPLTLLRHFAATT
jgi:hypothetical protein